MSGIQNHVTQWLGITKRMRIKKIIISQFIRLKNNTIILLIDLFLILFKIKYYEKMIIRVLGIVLILGTVAYYGLVLTGNSTL